MVEHDLVPLWVHEFSVYHVKKMVTYIQNFTKKKKGINLKKTGNVLLNGDLPGLTSLGQVTS